MPTCNTCGREFSTEVALAQHIKDKHTVEERTPQATIETQKEKTRRKSLRRRNRHPVAIGLAAVAIAVGLGLYFVIAPSLAPPPVACSSGESWIHVHPYLQIRIGNTSVTVPDAIGFFSKCPSGLAVMHTHDSSGIIHIELTQADSNVNYTLGDFFRVWNATFPTVTIDGTSHPVTLSNADIFGFKTDATHKVIVLVDGKAVTNGVKVPLEQLDYCSTSNASVPPCSQTAGSDPLWDGGATYPYHTGHTIVIEYTSA